MQRLRGPGIIALVCALAALATVAVILLTRHRPHPAATPIPAADQAVLNRFFADSRRQQSDLLGFRDTVTIDASLTAVHKSAEYVLQGTFIAPKTLKFKPVRHSGDSFVIHDIILGFLGRRAHYAAIGREYAGAILPENFNFQYLGEQPLNDTRALVFSVSAKRSGPGLFNGRIFLAADTAFLLRAEGTLVDSPTIFAHKVTFVRDYAQVGGFTLPTHLHTQSHTRIAGPAVMDVYHRNYQVHAASATQSAYKGRTSGGTKDF